MLDWKQYEPLIQAVVTLFHPFVEAAVHDLEEGKVVAIYHNISQRKVGDPSPLHELKVPVEKFPPYFAPYYKQNWDGRSLKCTSITIRNPEGKAVGLICINVDVSFFQEGQKLLAAFLSTQAENPIETYGSQTQVAALIEQYLKQQSLSLPHLNRHQKKELVCHLYRKGIFHFKNAAPQVATLLKTSRATIYNYIKQIDG